jgi:hypothetical protein
VWAREGLKKELRRGQSDVAEDPGDVRECALAGPWRGAGRVELIGEAHGAEREREKGRAGQRLGVWQNGPARQRGKRGVGRGKQLAPTSWPHRAERGRGKHVGQKPPLTGGAHLSGGAGAWARGLAGPAGLLCLFLFL